MEPSLAHGDWESRHFVKLHKTAKAGRMGRGRCLQKRRKLGCSEPYERGKYNPQGLPVNPMSPGTLDLTEDAATVSFGEPINNVQSPWTRQATGSTHPRHSTADNSAPERFKHPPKGFGCPAARIRQTDVPRDMKLEFNRVTGSPQAVTGVNSDSIQTNQQHYQVCRDDATCQA